MLLPVRLDRIQDGLDDKSARYTDILGSCIVAPTQHATGMNGAAVKGHRARGSF